MSKETIQSIPMNTDNPKHTPLAMIRALLLGILFMAAFILIAISGALVNPRSTLCSQLKQQWMKISLKALGIRIKVHNSDVEVQTLPSPALWVSNHVSWTDINVLNSLGQVTFLSKAEVKKWPIVGWLASATGTLFVKRGSGNGSKIVNHVAEVLNNSQSVVIFPEATTTDGTDLKRFFHPIFAAVTQQLHPIIPITIVYERHGQRCALSPYHGNDVFGQHLWRLIQLRGITAHVTIHPALLPTTEDTPKTLSKRAEDSVRSGLQPF